MKFLVPIFLILLSFSIYTATLCPTVFVGDSGELITAANSLGIAHPPGYPIYGMFGKLFIVLLPAASIAFRTNLMSALFASLSVFMVFIIIRSILSDHSYLISAVFSICFALSSTFWAQAVSSEVYSIHILLSAIAIYLLLKENFSFKIFILIIFILGLSIVQHPTAILLASGLFIYMIYNYRSVKGTNWILYSAMLFVIGLSLYLYLPIRSISNPAIDWSNTENLTNMVQHLSRKQYGRISKLSHSLPLFIKQVLVYLEFAVNQFTPWILLLAPFGIYRIYRSNLYKLLILMALFFSFSFILIIILNYDTTPRIKNIVEVFFLPSFMILSVFMAAGSEYLLSLFKRTKFIKLILSLLIILLPAMIFKRNFAYSNLSDTYIAYDFGKNLLNYPVNNSIYFISQDNEVFTIAYLNKTEGFRKNEILIYDELGCIYENIFGEDFLKISNKEHAQRLTFIETKILAEASQPVYFVFSSNIYRMDGIKKEQAGLSFKSVRKKEDSFPFPPSLKTLNLRDIDNIKTEDYLMLDILAQYNFLIGSHYFAISDKERAVKSFRRASEIGEKVEWVASNVAKSLTDKGLISEALEEYKREIKYFPNKPEAHYRLAYAYTQKGMTNEAIEEYKNTIKIKPDYSEALYNLGNIYMRLGMNNEAIPYYVEAIKYAPEKEEAYLNLGVVYEDLGRGNEAIEQYKKALAVKADYTKAMNNLAGLYISSERYEEAINLYENAIRLEPGYANAYYNMGYAYAKKGIINKAVLCWRKTLELDPSHPLAKELLNKFAGKQ